MRFPTIFCISSGSLKLIYVIILTEILSLGKIKKGSSYSEKIETGYLTRVEYTFGIHFNTFIALLAKNHVGLSY